MKKIILITLMLGVIMVVTPPLTAQEDSFKVIVNTDNPVSTMTGKEISNAFLKKNTKWENGEAIMPVDLVSTSNARVAFSNSIHGRKIPAVKAYWQKQIFSGRKIPPAEKRTDSEIMRFVQENPGAIGYISNGVSTSGYRVKIIKIN